MSKYVWIIILLITIYVLYTNDYQNYLITKLVNFLHDINININIPEYSALTLQNYFSKLIPSTQIISNELESDKNSLTDDNKSNSIIVGEKIFEISELKQYSNIKDGLYLAILGLVYDVTKGKKHYGPEGSYHSFVGKDASLAFVTGDFTEEGLIDDVSSLTPLQIKTLNDWAMFYAKDYIYKGKLVGRYYDSAGNPTEEYKKIQEKLALADKEKSNEEQRQRIFPPCNIEWKPDVGSRLWCTKKSGGIERDWIGVPRMLYETGSEQYRCTCVNLKSKEYEIHKGNLREYDGCPRGSHSCVVKNNDS